MKLAEKQMLTYLRDKQIEIIPICQFHMMGNVTKPIVIKNILKINRKYYLLEDNGDLTTYYWSEEHAVQDLTEMYSHWCGFKLLKHSA